ncbi:MAG: hypothetical protein KAJ19_25735, partial [Gammaproteobacteria bacterium]|nr:hypothetical protein [Gammaproteobacteria bacterium]
EMNDEVLANLQGGEYVVPQGGSLVAKDDRVVDKLSEIAQLLRDGNGRFRILVDNPGRAVEAVANLTDAAFSV